MRTRTLVLGGRLRARTDDLSPSLQRRDLAALHREAHGDLVLVRAPPDRSRRHVLGDRRTDSTADVPSISRRNRRSSRIPHPNRGMTRGLKAGICWV